MLERLQNIWVYDVGGGSSEKGAVQQGKKDIYLQETSADTPPIPLPSVHGQEYATEDARGARAPGVTTCTVGAEYPNLGSRVCVCSLFLFGSAPHICTRVIVWAAPDDAQPLAR